MRNDKVFHQNIKVVLTHLVITRFAILFEEAERVFVNYNSGHPFELQNIEDDLVQKIFSFHTKSSDVQTILVYEERPAIRFYDGKVISKYGYFLDIIQKREGLNIQYRAIGGTLTNVKTFYAQLFSQRRFEMTFNSFFRVLTAAPKLMTYDEFGFCVLVPKPEADNIIKGVLLEVSVQIFESNKKKP
jgi:hypothetical protein